MSYLMCILMYITIKWEVIMKSLMILPKFFEKLSGVPSEDFNVYGKFLNENQEQWNDWGVGVIKRCLFLMTTRKLNIKEIYENVARINTYQEFTEIIQQEFEKQNFEVARIMFEIFLGIHYEEAMDYQNRLHKCFANPIQKILYLLIFEIEEEIQPPKYSWGHFFTNFGSILFELNEYERSEVVLDIAIHWNPYDTLAYFELGEIYKLQKNWEKYLDFNQMAFRTISDTRLLARYYRNLSFYYIEQNELQKAANLLAYSASYEYHPLVENELLYINTLNSDIRPDWFMNTKEYLKRENIPTEVNDFVVEVIKYMMTEYQRIGEVEIVNHLEDVMKSLKIRSNVDQSLRSLYYPKN